MTWQWTCAIPDADPVQVAALAPNHSSMVYHISTNAYTWNNLNSFEYLSFPFAYNTFMRRCYLVLGIGLTYDWNLCIEIIYITCEVSQSSCVYVYVFWCISKNISIYFIWIYKYKHRYSVIISELLQKFTVSVMWLWYLLQLYVYTYVLILVFVHYLVTKEVWQLHCSMLVF